MKQLLINFLFGCALFSVQQCLAQSQLTSKVSSVTDTVPVDFKPVSNLAAFVKTYPFLTEYISGLRQEIKTMDTEIYAASVTLKGGKLLFLYLEGPLYRGTEGMPVDAYLNQGKGFKSVFNAVTYPEIKVIKSPRLALLLASASGTPIRWIYDKQKGMFKINNL